MALVKKPSKALLFFAIMYAGEEKAQKALKVLVKKFGPVLLESEEYDFNFSAHYLKEFGGNLKKRLVCFEKKISREDIVKIRLLSQKLEKKFSAKNNRTVNLDPGYITEHDVILVSLKEMPHKIYLGKGVFGEVEMIFKKGNSIEYPWYVHHDYKTKTLQDFFIKTRKNLLGNHD